MYEKSLCLVLWKSFFLLLLIGHVSFLSGSEKGKERAEKEETHPGREKGKRQKSLGSSSSYPPSILIFSTILVFMIRPAIDISFSTETSSYINSFVKNTSAMTWLLLSSHTVYGFREQICKYFICLLQNFATFVLDTPYLTIILYYTAMVSWHLALFRGN